MKRTIVTDKGMKALVGVCHSIVTMVIYFFLITSLAACSNETVLSDLSSIQMQEVIATLSHAGIRATSTKEKGSSSKFQVEVTKGDSGRAHELLYEHGLPHHEEQTFEELTASQGLIPPPLEIELLRKDRAAALDVERLLLEDPRITSSRALVRSGEGGGISVIIQKKKGASLSEEEIVPFVINALPKMTKNQISIVITEGGGAPVIDHSEERRVPFLLFAEIAESQYATVALLFLITVLLAASAGVCIGYFRWGYNRQNFGNKRL